MQARRMIEIRPENLPRDPTSAIQNVLDGQVDFVAAHQTLPKPGDLDSVGEAAERTERPTGAAIHGYVLVTTRREERPSTASVIGRSPAKAGGQVVGIQVRVGQRGRIRGAYCVTVQHLAT
jgi:hypothetical protein